MTALTLTSSDFRISCANGLPDYQANDLLQCIATRASAMCRSRTPNRSRTRLLKLVQQAMEFGVSRAQLITALQYGKELASE